MRFRRFTCTTWSLLNSQLMGFAIPNEDEYYEDDEFEDKGKIKVGFQIK